MANKTKNKKPMDPLTAGAIGAGIGALAGAAAVALSDEKTRKKLGREFSKFEKKIEDATSDTEHKIAEIKGEAAKLVAPKGKKSK